MKVKFIFISAVCMICLGAGILCRDTMSRLVFKFGSYCQNHIMMFLTQLTYCIMVIRRIAKKREENAYMIIPRYKSFRAYYGSVYRELVGTLFCIRRQF